MSNKYAEAIAEIQARTVFALAADAECGAPDHDGTAGASFLRSVRDGLVEAVLDGSFTHLLADEDNRIHEIADGAPDVYTDVKWAEFVDLAAYNEDPSELAADDADMGDRASVCLYIIAERLCRVLLAELDTARTEDDDADADAEVTA